MAPDWAAALAPVDDRVARVSAFLDGEVAAGRRFLPAEDLVFRAFRRPLADVRVLVVGQDPYPTPGHAIGLSFAVDAGVRPLPRSLANIYRELATDTGTTPPAHGDLTSWADQGVMLLNRVLTVQAGAAGSHRRKGWEAITTQAVTALAARGGPLAAILWGKDAQSLTPLLSAVPYVAAAHPSPMAANMGGFFDTRPFSRVNELLAEQGAAPVDWSLPPA